LSRNAETDQHAAFTGCLLIIAIRPLRLCIPQLVLVI